ncbi:MAG: DNA-directed RNA polymerase subunit alpha [Patescibacteria group bacterium]|nr:DNA-directed RNA polymerase subunit alpha [Patescibacteria group bacterium]MDD4304330.1 DNA-directed RNA polymerase subunit alpha [Patescibacteria group bacterium]MDD4695593.1 DNA-directed RNA polymerase subunit alpha [Patescibacteria group bacterium]
MDNIALPQKIEYKKVKENQKEIIIEPLFPGYGITIANSLRRVLLSSLVGSAITKVKIKDVSHEFSTLPYLKEDIVELILNIKKIRVKSYSDEPIKFRLKITGENEVKAGDIEKNAQLEVVNPDLVIAHLTDKKAELDIEFTAEKGRGYVMVEEKSGYEDLAVNEISLDSLFSPIVNVSFSVEAVRVGKKTDYEKLVMKVETDGSIQPEEAILRSIKILMSHFALIDQKEPEIEEPIIEKKEKAEKPTSAKVKVDKKEKKEKVEKKEKKIDKIDKKEKKSKK